MMEELLEELGKHKGEIYVDGLKADEVYLTDGSVDFLFEELDNICFNDGEEK